MKNTIVHPNAMTPPPVLQIGEIPMFVVADMRASGGFLQIVEGDSALAIPTPSCRLQAGQMLVLIPTEIAEQMRPHLDEAIAKARQALPPQNGRPS